METVEFGVPDFVTIGPLITADTRDSDDRNGCRCPIRGLSQMSRSPSSRGKRGESLEAPQSHQADFEVAPGGWFGGVSGDALRLCDPIARHPASLPTRGLSGREKPDRVGLVTWTVKFQVCSFWDKLTKHSPSTSITDHRRLTLPTKTAKLLKCRVRPRRRGIRHPRGSGNLSGPAPVRHPPPESHYKSRSDASKPGLSTRHPQES